MEIRSPYQRVRTPLDFSGEPSVTDTSFGNDTDVNNIVAKFHRTGVMPTPPGSDNCEYADVTGLQKDLTTLIAESNAAIDKLKQEQKKNNEAQQREITENAIKAQRLEKMLKEQQESLNASPDQPQT